MKNFIITKTLGMRAQPQTAKLCIICCFLFEWHTMDRKHRYIQKQWPKRESRIPLQQNIVNTPLINPEEVYSPPLDNKLGLINKFLQSNESKQRRIHVFKKYVSHDE